MRCIINISQVSNIGLKSAFPTAHQFKDLILSATTFGSNWLLF